MVIANPPLAEPVIDPGGVTIKPPFEMGVANLDIIWIQGCLPSGGRLFIIQKNFRNGGF